MGDGSPRSPGIEARSNMKLFLLLCATGLALNAGTALAQAPGASVTGCVLPAPVVIAENNFCPTCQPGNPEYQPYSFPCGVYQGTVVLLEDSTKPATDPHNWSDVLVFKLAQATAPELPGSTTLAAVYVSDIEDAAGNSNGITDAELAAAGVAPAAVLMAQTIVYMAESTTSDHNFYNATGPDGVTTQYDLQSDPGESPTPTESKTWGSVKAHYH
jgi:hypothetical protein